MKVIKDMHGTPYAIQFWRVVFYAWDIRKPKYMRTGQGGIMINFYGKRVHARPLFWLFCFVSFSETRCPPNATDHRAGETSPGEQNE